LNLINHLFQNHLLALGLEAGYWLLITDILELLSDCFDGEPFNDYEVLETAPFKAPCF